MMRRLCLLAAGLCTVWAAQAQAPAEFAWRATLETPRAAALVRLPLPAEALMRLQSPDAADLRIFDAEGRAVPFSLSTPPAADSPAREPTRRYPALPLHASPPAGAGARGATQVRIEEAGTQRSVWVQLSPGAAGAAASQRLPSALFDTRSDKRSITGLIVHAQLPPNEPVEVRVSTSADLAQWTPVAVRGRLYRFDGEDAPRNDRLELASPLRLEGRFLRLDWRGVSGVSVQAVTGLAARAPAVGARVTAVLGEPRREGANALEWELGFATPVAQLDLTTSRANTLLPVRILGRERVSEPWRELGRTVVWRLGLPGTDQANPPAVLRRASVRWLRVESTHGMQLEGVPLQARVAFDPLQVVFVAGGDAPYQLAAGRAGTAPAALPLAMLSNAANVEVADLPSARISAVETGPVREPTGWQRWLPRGWEPRIVLLWAVLAAAVLLLGGVAWSLLRQLNRKTD